MKKDLVVQPFLKNIYVYFFLFNASVKQRCAIKNAQQVIRERIGGKSVGRPTVWGLTGSLLCVEATRVSIVTFQQE